MLFLVRAGFIVCHRSLKTGQYRNISSDAEGQCLGTMSTGSDANETWSTRVRDEYSRENVPKVVGISSADHRGGVRIRLGGR